ncbi:MAG TPA: cupredoxin domain-containing protein [Nitrospiria bacterium]|nr:cupredoxin domain-containing protein [Nitrospiria bacterium]
MKRRAGLQVGLILGLGLWLFGTAAAEETIRIVIKDHRFTPSEVKVKANTKAILIVTNEDQTAEEFESSSLNREKVVRPGQSINVLLPALKPGSYDFYGDFHPDTAQGKIIAE